MRSFQGRPEPTINGGAFTPDELAAAARVGYVNEYQPTGPGGARLTAVDIANQAHQRAGRGWRVVAGLATHNNNPEPPEGMRDPILMGWVRVNHGDPAAPIWLARA